MILRTRRGRPRGPTPLFAHECTRLDATCLLAKSRGVDLQTDAERWVQSVRLTWTDPSGRPQARSIHLTIVAVPQPFGGQRWWWRCPICHQRRGVLFLATPDGPVACRPCGRVRYKKAYPGRARHRDEVDVLRWFLSGAPQRRMPEVDALLAPRRRGVRRGRRVLLRAGSALIRAWRESNDILAAARSLSEHP